MMCASDRPLRILHVISSMNYGGIEIWLMNVLRNIDRKRFLMDFLVHTDQSCTFESEIRSLGSKIIPCLSPSRPWMYTSNFRNLMREYGPYDIIHSHVYLFSGFTLSIAAMLGVKTRIAHIYPQIDKREQTLLRHAYTKIMRWLIALNATAIFADSRSSLVSFRKDLPFPASRIMGKVVYPVVDLTNFKKPIDRDAVRIRFGLPLNQKIVLYVARFVPHKNHLFIPQLAHRLKAMGSTAHFVLCGADGPTRAQIQQIARDTRCLSVLVDVPDTSEIVRAADIFIFPSLNEGFGIVALEAQAAGLPVIATNLLTIQEVLAPELRRMTFAPNDIDNAAHQLNKLLLSPQLCEELAKAGKTWAEKFSFDYSIKTLENIYTALISTR